MTVVMTGNVRELQVLGGRLHNTDIVIAPLNISMPTDLREKKIFFFLYHLIVVILIIAIAPGANTLTAGFKIVFDNIDSTIRPRHMTEERRPVSLHNVHAYAVKDRVDYSAFASTREPGMEQQFIQYPPK